MRPSNMSSMNFKQYHDKTLKPCIPHSYIYGKNHTPYFYNDNSATLTSSELYTQTLAAEADVLRAAQAWPVLVNDLTDMTNPPARQQLAIVYRGFPYLSSIKS